MFLNNKYTKWYWKIIKNNIVEEGYTESHHIIPKCMGGDNHKDNLIRLSARKHYICHLLLTKMVNNKQHKKSLIYAFMKMCGINNKWQKHRYTAKLYQQHKKIITKEMSGKNNFFYGKRFTGESNPFYGKKHTKEALLKMKLNRPSALGVNNSFYGKKHTKENRQYLSIKRSKPIQVIFYNNTCKYFLNALLLGEYLKYSKSLGAKLLKPGYQYLWPRYKIKNIERISHEIYCKNSQS